MRITTIDSLYLAVPNLDAACRPYERLGLRLSDVRKGRRIFFVGGEAGYVSVHLLAEHDFLAEPLRRARGTLFAVGLRVDNLAEAVQHLAAQGVAATTFRDGDRDAAWLPLHEQAGADLILVQTYASALMPVGAICPLRRLDHLATVTPDLEAKTRFWADVLGVDVTGEVRTPTLVIRQLKIGAAVLELLGPADADSPLWQRPPGLVSMASWEVQELDGLVDRYRAAGFTVPDAAPGPLPRTRITTIPGTELGGLNVQLLEPV